MVQQTSPWAAGLAQNGKDYSKDFWPAATGSKELTVPSPHGCALQVSETP